MADTFYHNITKQKFNITDEDEIVEISTVSDIIAYTKSGNALLTIMSSDEISALVDRYQERNKE